MKRLLTAAALLLIAYLASGFYVLKGNEKGVVRRFGRVLTGPSGRVVLRRSGLHYDLPWPLAKVDRVNLDEVRTLTIGTSDLEEAEGNVGDFLRAAGEVNRSEFLTGNKNILNLQITVQYRISGRRPGDFLFRSESPERHLKLLVEAAAAELIAGSGVDFVHPLGLVELRGLLTERSRRLAEEHRLGIEVEEAAISAVYPPPEVKHAFLEVANARAARQKYVNDARAYAEQRRAKADAEARQILDEAEIYRQKIVERARGQAQRFTKAVEEFDREDEQGVQTRSEARAMAMRRMYIEAMEEILGSVEGKVYLDSGESLDLTIFRDPNR